MRLICSALLVSFLLVSTYVHSQVVTEVQTGSGVVSTSSSYTLKSRIEPFSYDSLPKSQSYTLNPSAFGHAGVDPIPPSSPVISQTEVFDGEITLYFYVSSNGGATPSYKAECIDGRGVKTSATGSKSPITVTNLENETNYTCTVTASNVAGDSTSSPSTGLVPESYMAGLPVWLLYEASK